MLIFVIGLLIKIDMVYKNSLPLITLPEYSHNTIGEIPMVKEMDKTATEIAKGYSSRYGMMMITGSILSYSGNGGDGYVNVYYSDY